MTPIDTLLPRRRTGYGSWSAYNAGLCQRGSLTIWLSSETIDGWRTPKREGRGDADAGCELEAKGRVAWQKAHGYGQRILAETTMGRYKSIIGDRLRSHHDLAQPMEVAIVVKALNHMMNLAKPISVRVG